MVSSINMPNGLGEVYVEVHKRLRNHLTLPSYYCKSISNQFIKELALMALVNAEQTLEKWLSAKMKSPVSGTTASLLGNSGQESFPIGTHDLFSSDLLYLESLSTFRDILTNTWLHFAVRVYWLKSRYLMLQGKRDLALSCFDYCSHLLTLGDSDLPPSNIPIVVHLPNCKDDIISARAVKKQVESLQRCQSLEEVQRLYETGNYQDVVDILYPTLTQTSLSKSKLKEDSRPARLLLLIESLLHTKNYELCVSCCLLALNESLQQLSNGSTMAVKENWLTTMTKVFQFLNKCLSVKLSVISQLARISVIQLTNTVIRIIELAMDSMDATDQPVISTVLPWVILYRLIKHEEDSFKAQIQHDEQKEMKLMPSSLMLLYRAHEYLGGRGWCCNSDGYLLTFYVDVLQEELKNREDALRQDMCLALEQCLYCLYGHPNKKAKARHLQDHGVEEVPLTWGKAVFVFDYFKPKTVPDFDSYKTSSMSGELESLFLKISKVIPVQKDPPVTMDTVNAYIEGISDKPPSIPEDKPVTLHVVKELFYLLADYYFKNKEWGKAIKFYMHDICVCPDRFDSWAGQALARSSRLEAKLSSCDVKNEGSMQKNAQLALRCFQRALEVDPSNYTLWIEYGSLAYTLHSHFSRQLKQQKTQVSMVPETIQCLTNKKNEMLSLAKKCFLTADKCEDDGEAEEWLIQYMLGKIAEKQKDKPLGFLEYYKKASCHLHDDEACYPKKIHYHNPPDLAMEALEVYYRLHAAVLKLLQEHDKEYCIDYQTLERCLIEAANSPFAKGLQKESDSSSLHSIQDSSKPTYTATPMDHDYVLSHTKTKLNISESSQSNKQHVIAESSQGDKQQTVSEISQGEKQHAVSEIGQGDKQHVVSEIGQGEKQQAVSEISQSDKQHAVSEIGQGDKQQTKHEDKPQMDEQQMLNQCGELLLQLSELQQPETEVFRNLESLLEETKKEQQDELTHQPEKETHSLQQSDTQSQGIKQSDKQFPQGPHAEQPMEQSEDGDIALWKDNEQFIEQMKNKTEPQIQSMLELEELVLVLSDSSSDIDGKLGSAPPPPPPPAASSAGSPKTANTSKPTKTDKGITPGDEEKRLKLVNLCMRL
ncbi:calcineurin-binding protein cabin-1-like [Saccoglossus kowalevskii]